jgi:glutamate-1-semialdehyde 2,1-aminomutase
MKIFLVQFASKEIKMSNLTKPRSYNISQQLVSEIKQFIPGGVNSPFRSFNEVGGTEIFFEHANGSYLFDVDGNKYIDYLGSWGPAILGHSHPQIIKAIENAVRKGNVFGAPHKLEIELAKQIMSIFNSIESIRFVNSGTEAVMSAIRLARGYTKRDYILMFAGCYHGHSDSVLSSRGHSSSAGIPESFSENTLLVPFNDLQSLKDCLTTFKGKIAAVLIEPIAGSMGVIPPQPEYLLGIKQLIQKIDPEILFIFDEVLTGLRVALGGAQAFYDVKPDLTCFGKALGGGMPIGAYGGRKDIMDYLDPIGKVYQAGTFSGNPVTMASGIETINLLKEKNVYQYLDQLTQMLFDELTIFIRKHNLEIQLQRVGSMFSILFAPKPILNYEDSKLIKGKAFAQFFHRILDQGLYFPPSSVDAACLSHAHSSEDIEISIKVICQALNQ